MSASVNKKKFTLILFGGMVFLSAVSALLGSLLSQVIQQYGLDSSSQGLASMFQSLGGMVAFVIALYLAGRVRKTILLLDGFVLCAVFLSMLSFLPPFAVFVGLWFFTGIGMGLMDALLSSCIADLYTGPDATRMMCNMHCTFGISSMATPLICSGLITCGLKWNKIYLLVSLYGVLLVIALFSMNRKTSSNSFPSEKKMTPADFKLTLRSGTLLFFVFGMLFHGFFLGGMNTWVNYYVGTLSDNLGNAALSFLFTGVLASRFLLPYTGIEPKIFIRYAGFIAAVVLLSVLPFQNGLVACIGIALSSFCFGAFIPCMLTVACAENADCTLMTTSLMMLALYLGQSIASPVLGFCETNLSLRFGLVLCAVCMVLTSLTFVICYRKNEREAK